MMALDLQCVTIGTIGSLVKQEQTSSFLLNTFFPSTFNSNAALVRLDTIVPKNELARFVACCVDAKGRLRQDPVTQYMQPAYIKEYNAIEACCDERMIGEPLEGWSTQDRLAAKIAMEQGYQFTAIQNRLEWMAANALLNGGYTISGDGFPAYDTDFGRDTANTYTPALTWDNPLANPKQDIQKMMDLAFIAGRAQPTHIVMGTEAFDAAAGTQPFNDIIRNNGYSVAGIPDFNLAAPVTGGMYRGNWGNVQVWTYSNRYIDEAGVSQEVFDPRAVVVSSAAANGVQGIKTFGRIKNAYYNGNATDVFTFSEIQSLGKAIAVQSEANALVIPRNINATASAIVLP